jgi:Fe-S oxidoreductase
MCPSFRVTREEEHSTRGRAHLLWEMANGEVIHDGWRSEEVKNSLDLCLSCKGCKSDCPVAVDVATYKAEFLSHYHQGRLRPLNHYAFGNIDLWLRLASNAAGLVNLTTQLPFLRDIAKRVAGVSRQRNIPALAPRTFRNWFRRHTPLHPDGPLVVIWPDTFNNYFLPGAAIAAVDVLEHAGFRVELPRGTLCCGRPLYDFGMLDRAESLLLEILDALAPEIEAGIPIIGLEPSCITVFRDELCNLFPNDERARRLSRQTVLLSEFLQSYKDLIPLPRLERKAIVHGHCHHKSILKMNAEEAVLSRMGLDCQAPAPGCCGMAGSFGFENDKYEVSIAIGELELLPAVRKAPPEWLVIANGFSCREQIAQETDRHALHLAEVLQMALHEGPSGPQGSYPERRLVRQREADLSASMQRTSMAVAGLVAGAALLWHLRNK